MAHNLYYNDQTGKHSFFSVQQKAWHGLGQIVQDYPTSAAAMEAAGLDYRVEKRRLFTFDSTNLFGNADTLQPTIEVPAYYATVRTDNDAVLGVVGRDYKVVQNRDAFSFFDAIVGADGIQYETAGALGKGERIFITAKLPHYIKVGREDLIEQYLFLTTAHDGSGSITAAFTPVRIVCNNTLNAALKNCSNAIKIRHTANAKERLTQAHRVMGISNQLSVQLENLFNRWATVRICDQQVKKLIQMAMAPGKEHVQPVEGENDDATSSYFKHVCEAVQAYAATHPTQQLETTKGTLFGAYNAITGYFQNERHYKNAEAKLRSLLLGGTAQQRTQKAFDLCKQWGEGGHLHLN